MNTNVSEIIFLSFFVILIACQLSLFKCAITVGGVASGGVRATFSSPDENDRAGGTASKPLYQPTLATPRVGTSTLIYHLFSISKAPPNSVSNPPSRTTSCSALKTTLTPFLITTGPCDCEGVTLLPTKIFLPIIILSDVNV